MANEEQIELLKKGVKTWNEFWRGIPAHPIPFLTGDLENGIPAIRANLRGADLSFMNLSHIDLNNADLRDANFNYAKLNDADLIGAHLNSTDLSNVDLSGANMRSSKLNTANLSRADLRYADLSNVDLTKAQFANAVLGGTVFYSVDLSVTNNLEEAQFLFPCQMNLETIQFSKGNIPPIVLRGCGLSDIQIEFAKLSAPDLDSERVTDITYKIHQMYLGGGIQYYSCFISYSSKDQEFAQRLHDDLQNNGIRCWFDREDLKIGDAIRPTIDRQIRLRDKLLVILSENSINSEWVGDEVEGALEEEQKGNRSVLFPIRLDDTALNTRDDWAAKIKRRRHIGDFSNWKDKASYQKAFERLLRDLKATG